MTDQGAKALDAAQGVVTVCDALATMVNEGFDSFAHDQRTQWAVEMGLIRIGEGITGSHPRSLPGSPTSPGARSSPCAASPRTSTTTWPHDGSGPR